MYGPSISNQVYAKNRTKEPTYIIAPYDSPILRAADVAKVPCLRPLSRMAVLANAAKVVDASTNGTRDASTKRLVAHDRLHLHVGVDLLDGSIDDNLVLLAWAASLNDHSLRGNEEAGGELWGSKSRG
ncbi:hypothetical protein E4U36_001592 [Claviceps purpurea]|nr:hypothetical protein E4U36_001592 [Claviceps purpurea]